MRAFPLLIYTPQSYFMPKDAHLRGKTNCYYVNIRIIERTTQEF